MATCDVGQSTPSCCFVEIDDPKSEEDSLPDWIDCYVIVNIDPKYCGSLARDLNFILPLRSTTPQPTPSTSDGHGAAAAAFPKTEHLRRIRRRMAASGESRGGQVEIETAAAARSSTPNEVRECKDCSCNGDENIKPPTSTKPAEHQRKRSKSSKNGKQKDSSSWSLDVLVGSVVAVDHLLNVKTDATLHANMSDAASKQMPSLHSILQRYNISPQSPNFVRRTLPGRPAHTKEELETWNKSVWQTLFHEEKTERYKKEQLALTAKEAIMMLRGMKQALEDARVGQDQYRQWKSSYVGEGGSVASPQHIPGVIIVDPQTDLVVSRSSGERLLQASGSNTQLAISSWPAFPDEDNPLCTPTLLAIQGVSRNERQVASGCGMESKEFRDGQVRSDCVLLLANAGS